MDPSAFPMAQRHRSLADQTLRPAEETIPNPPRASKQGAAVGLERSITEKLRWREVVIYHRRVVLIRRRGGSPAGGQSRGGPSAATKPEKCPVAKCGADLSAGHAFGCHIPEVLGWRLACLQALYEDI